MGWGGEVYYVEHALCSAVREQVVRRVCEVFVDCFFLSRMFVFGERSCATWFFSKQGVLYDDGPGREIRVRGGRVVAGG